MFLPDDPSHQDVQQKPLLLTMAYAQVLQYWAEEASLPAPDDPHPLAMNVVELRWHVGRCITFSKQDVLKGLASAIPEAKDWDMGIPPVDSVASPTMTDVRGTWLSPTKTQWADDTISPSPRYQSKAKIEDQGTPPVDFTTSPGMADAKDTQPSPMETPPADDTTVPLAKPDAETQKDLPTIWATIPALRPLQPPYWWQSPL